MTVEQFLAWTWLVSYISFIVYVFKKSTCIIERTLFGFFGGTLAASVSMTIIFAVLFVVKVALYGS